MTSMAMVRTSDSTLQQALRLAVIFAAVKLAFQFVLTLWTEHLGYGYFRDEFYYIECGRHLAWGYVDHGPIVALQARLGEVLFSIAQTRSPLPPLIRNRIKSTTLNAQNRRSQ
jgi:hypothetical protein